MSTEPEFEVSSVRLEGKPESILISFMTQFSLNVPKIPVCLHISLFSQETHPTKT